MDRDRSDNNIKIHMKRFVQTVGYALAVEVGEAETRHCQHDCHYAHEHKGFVVVGVHCCVMYCC